MSFSPPRNPLLLVGLASSVLTPHLARAADDDKKDDNAIVVTGQRLDQAREQMDPSIGANQYLLDRQTLDAQPGGADRSLKGVLLQAPGISQDSDGDGDIHIRNEHGNVQYRLNGITVPQGFAGFGASVDPRIADSIEILTGPLPAQYGFRTAGVVSLKTRATAFDLDGGVGIYGGSNNTLQPSFTLSNSAEKLNYFVSGSYLRSDLGISNPTSARKAIHDRTEQERGFAYLSYLTGENSRVSVFGGTSFGEFEIPNTPGLAPQYALAGRTSFDSATLDARQDQQNHFGVLAYQYAGDKFDVQVAPFVRYARAHYRPDSSGGHLMFDGADSNLVQASTAYGLQADSGYKLNERHHLRAGVFVQRERTTTDSLNRVFRVDALGDQASDLPLTIPVGQRNSGTSLGIYVQDEWSVTDALTVNYGVRYDRSEALVTEDQFSPRIGLVWAPNDATNIHAGYARNFTPPPLEIVASANIGAFAGTTGAAQVTRADPVRSEREHSFDLGASHKIGPVTLSLDAYYKLKRNLLDEEHFGATLIQSPFNYDRSKGWGAEFGVNYESKPVEAYINVARGQQKAKRIVSNQFFFEPDELSYIDQHYIYTDHSQKWTASGGGALSLHNSLGKFQPSFDFIYGSGLRAEDPAGVVPNGGTQKPYVQVNLGVMQVFGQSEEHNFSIRFDVVNLFDKVYLIHDGSGVGAGQPEWGPRRGFFVGVRKAF